MYSRKGVRQEWNFEGNTSISLMFKKKSRQIPDLKLKRFTFMRKTTLLKALDISGATARLAQTIL